MQPHGEGLGWRGRGGGRERSWVERKAWRQGGGLEGLEWLEEGLGWRGKIGGREEGLGWRGRVGGSEERLEGLVGWRGGRQGRGDGAGRRSWGGEEGEKGPGQAWTTIAQLLLLNC